MINLGLSDLVMGYFPGVKYSQVATNTMVRGGGGGGGVFVVWVAPTMVCWSHPPCSAPLHQTYCSGIWL